MQCVEGASPVGGGEVRLNCNQGGVWSAIPGSGCNCDPGLHTSADRRSCIGMYNYCGGHYKCACSPYPVSIQAKVFLTGFR